MDYNEYKIFKIKQSASKKLAIVGIVLAVIVVIGFIGIFISVSTTDDEASSGTSTSSSSLLASETDFCVVITDSETDEISLIASISAKLYNSIFSVTVVDKSTYGLADGVTQSLEDHYNQGGIGSLETALSEITGETYERYIIVTDSDLTLIFAELGHVIIDLPDSVVLTVSEGTVELEAGEQELDYEELADYLLNGISGDDILKQQGDVICEILRQYIEGADYTASEDIFDTVINYVTTDITVVDFTSAADVIATFENTEFTYSNTLA